MKLIEVDIGKMIRGEQATPVFSACGTYSIEVYSTLGDMFSVGDYASITVSKKNKELSTIYISEDPLETRGAYMEDAAMVLKLFGFDLKLTKGKDHEYGN